MQLETERLILRPFRQTDLDAYAALNSDPDVMRYYPSPYTREQSQASIDRCTASWERHGYGFSAVTDKDDVFLGLCGLSLFQSDLSFTPVVEIGWRFVTSAWGRGLASEAAKAWLKFGFQNIGLEEIVAFTAIPNRPSQKVMERIGMTRFSTYDFEMESIPLGHPLRPHVVYRMIASDLDQG